MQPLKVIWPLVVLVLLLVGSALVSPAGTVAAQDGTPPILGPVILEDALTTSALLPTGICPTGRVSAETTGEGYFLRVGGRCRDGETNAAADVLIPGLTLPDGEVKFDFKVVGAADRLSTIVYTRAGADGADRYAAALVPGAGLAQLSRIVAGRTDPVLAGPTELPALLHLDDWNSLAVRLAGPELWLLVNDQPVLSARDPTYATGRVALRLARTGDLDDLHEVGLLIRNLRVSAIADSPSDRIPTVAPDTQRPTAGPPSAPVAIEPPPAVGAAFVEDPLSTPRRLFAVEPGCPTGRNTVQFTGDGLLLRVTGRCSEASRNTQLLPSHIAGLMVGDGEVRLEVRAVQGPERARFVFGVREQPSESPLESYQLVLDIGGGSATLYRNNVVLTARPVAPPQLEPGGWNAVAIRARGPGLWILLNDAPLLAAVDPAYSDGFVYFGLIRRGDPADDAETSVAVRNLRVSRLAEPDPADAQSLRPAIPSDP